MAGIYFATICLCVFAFGEKKKLEKICSTEYKGDISTSGGVFDNETTDDVEVNVDDTYLENSHGGLLAYNNILDYFRGKQAVFYDDGIYSVNGISREGYPKYYSGCYKSKEGYLVLLIQKDYKEDVEANADWYKELKQAIGGYNYIIDYADNSYREMMEAMEWLDASNEFEKLCRKWDAFVVGCGINDMLNKVEIDFSREAVAKIQKLLESKYPNMFLVNGNVSETELTAEHKANFVLKNRCSALSTALSIVLAIETIVFGVVIYRKYRYKGERYE